MESPHILIVWNEDAKTEFYLVPWTPLSREVKDTLYAAHMILTFKQDDGTGPASWLDCCLHPDSIQEEDRIIFAHLPFEDFSPYLVIDYTYEPEGTPFSLPSNVRISHVIYSGSL